MRSSLVLAVLVTTSVTPPLRAQTIDDGLLLHRRALVAGMIYGHEKWSEYWEGTLQRDNENIGTMTTQSLIAIVGYGVTERLSVIATLPYIWTHASQGPLHGMDGVQDFTLAAKYQLLETPFTNGGTLRALVVGVAGIPASDYTSDFLPLSIGLHSQRLAGRFTLNFQAHQRWFLNGSAGYTWRGNVKLDRPAYYTNGQLYLTDEVVMPDVFDYRLSAGFLQGRLYVPVSLSQQFTLGGGDIRRQDMPFVSNRMNFTSVDGAVMYSLPAPRELGFRFGASRIVSGRNVGQATAVSGGLFYTFHF